MQLPILQVIIPIIASMFCFLTRKHRVSWFISFFTTAATFFISLMLLVKTYNGEIITYYLGDWAPPYGIELRIDILNSLILTLVNFIALISVLYSFYINEKEISKNKITGFYSLFLLCLSGLLGILVTNDIFNLYVFLEISSLSSYVLVSMGRDKKALVAAFEYLISGTVGATFYLFGIGLLYSMTGTLNMSDMAERIVPLYDNNIIRLGTLFIFVGLSIKMALFPLSKWLVNAYSEAPSFISVFFSGTVTKVMIYVFIRIFYNVFQQNFFLPLHNVIIILALCAIVFGSISAIIEKDIKRLFAHSSISQIGYILLMLGLNSKSGLFSAVLHIVNHSMIKTSLFMVAGCISYKFGMTKIENLSGLKKSMLYTTLAFTLLSLALIGVPLTNGFVSKWYMMQAILESHAWISLAVFAAGSFLALIYMWRVVEKMYFENSAASNTEMTLNEVPLLMLFCLLFMAILTIITGIYSSPIRLVINKFAF
ncbi:MULTISPECIES: proton-conducting transporter transmembrane domain-containing protein [Wolbachia]|uniref:proton-conducting transporter transmembrane domain-containing protein n=1 Tax=Wolbachia TaxID=953 RepID=UPI001BACAA6E|nr:MULTISPECIES: proton-conducting transporter membrane subunit [unclassified Wolbachia]QUI60021.1 cation:proton antiporter [Wolbachia endosymbiont of Spodoptera picta]URG40018.1 cation:proton antiporter [Wolbachia endosymbiont of Ostrinia furnacalis]URG41037.1 cation:proton antiporter [Wolbachia endosymbiont of Ostrinia scapulalis]